MVEKFWRTRKFKVLNQQWEIKLKDSGFIDAEEERNGDIVLKQRATNSYHQAHVLERETRLEYYTFLGYLAHNTKFPTALEALVMIRYSEGASINDIVRDIGLNGISRDRKTVRYIIRRWQMKWGVRSWSLRQMNLKKIIIK